MFDHHVTRSLPCSVTDSLWEALLWCTDLFSLCKGHYLQEFAAEVKMDMAIFYRFKPSHIQAPHFILKATDASLYRRKLGHIVTLHT